MKERERERRKKETRDEKEEKKERKKGREFHAHEDTHTSLIHLLPFFFIFISSNKLTDQT